MVLIIFILFSLVINNDGLLDQYHKQTHKTIQRQFDLRNATLVEQECKIGELYKVFDSNKQKGYVLLSEVAACNLGGCHQYKQIKNSEGSEFFDLLVVTDQDMNIKLIKILNYFSDFGYQVTSKKYLKKFIGKSVCAFMEDNDEIDIVSGATISSYALEGRLSQMCAYN